MIGSSASAVDISVEIAQVAKSVHIASRSVEGGMLEKLSDDAANNMFLHPMVKVLISGTWLSKGCPRRELFDPDVGDGY